MPGRGSTGGWRALSAGLIGLLALTGCGRGGVPAGAALPAACGPRREHAPAAPAMRASAAAADAPLPVWGPDVQAVAAAGSMLFASTFNAPDGRTLFVSTDGGASWTPADPPPLPAGWTLASMALSPDAAVQVQRRPSRGRSCKARSAGASGAGTPWGARARSRRGLQEGTFAGPSPAYRGSSVHPAPCRIASIATW
jgi:hypothetical protein